MSMFLYSLGQQWRQQRVARKLRFRPGSASATDRVRDCVVRCASCYDYDVEPAACNLICTCRTNVPREGPLHNYRDTARLPTRRGGRHKRWLTPVPYLEGAPLNASRRPSCASCHIFRTACKRYFTHWSRSTKQTQRDTSSRYFRVQNPKCVIKIKFNCMHTLELLCVDKQQLYFYKKQKLYRLTFLVKLVLVNTYKLITTNSISIPRPPYLQSKSTRNKHLLNTQSAHRL